MRTFVFSVYRTSMNLKISFWTASANRKKAVEEAELRDCITNILSTPKVPSKRRLMFLFWINVTIVIHFHAESAENGTSLSLNIFSRSFRCENILKDSSKETTHNYVWCDDFLNTGGLFGKDQNESNFINYRMLQRKDHVVQWTIFGQTDGAKTT